VRRLNFQFVNKKIIEFFENAHVIDFLTLYGTSAIREMSEYVREAEILFSEPGRGKEKLLFVLEKVHDLMVKMETIEEGDQIPDWIEDVIEAIVKLVNAFTD